jgi:ribonuclease P protein subunit RPR2
LRNKKAKESIAEKRIAELNAIATSDESMELRKNAIQIMEDLGKRMDISLQKEVKRNYCKNCKTPYGMNTRVRLKKENVIITCGECGKIRRIRYRPLRSQS